MKKLGVMLGTLAAAAALAAGVARAIQFGTPDATNQYAGVGLVVFYDSTNHPLWSCTGALISPRVLLTAAHCAGFDPALGAAPTRAQVWFDNGYPTQIPFGNYPRGSGASCDGYTGFPCTGDVGGVPRPHPGWTGVFTKPNSHDIGVVTLDRPLSLPTYRLAPVGTLDEVSKRGQNVSFVVTGYGIQQVKPVFQADRTRYVGTIQLKTLTSGTVDGYGIKTANSPGKGGGTCFGDSGGPVFYGGQIVGVNSWVSNESCRGSAGAFRTDTPLARDFLALYLL